MNRFSKSGRKAIEELGNHYLQDLEKPSSYDIQIDLDVPRTISGHIMFRTRYGLGYVSVLTLILPRLIPLISGNVLCSTSYTPSRYDATNVATCRAWVP